MPCCAARSTGWVIAIAVCFFACLHAETQDAVAQDKIAATSSTASDAVEVGITGHYRIGYWTAVRLKDKPADSSVSIETVDGDGARVVFEQSFGGADDEALFSYVVPGTEAAPLLLRSGESSLTATRFPTFGSPSRGPAAIPAEMSWIVCVGDPMGMDQIGANEILKRDALIAVSKPTSAASLPDMALGYDGVDLLVINQDGFELLAELNERQRSAMAEYITSGGRLFLTLGGSAKQLPEVAPWLLDLLPLGGDSLSTTQMNPSSIETFTATQTPLSEYTGLRLPKGVGRVLIGGRTARRVSTPISVEYTVGFGQIVVVAADLELQQFAEWPDRMKLLKRLLGSVLDLKKDENTTSSRLTAFDDLAGQTRATLDQFSIKRTFGFSILSLILMALIALIGPLDYLLINRVLGRPLLGWLTFPIAVLGLSAILVYQSMPRETATQSGDAAAASPMVRCNRIEIVDIDTTVGRGSGFNWNFLYTHDANQFDVAVEPTKTLKPLIASVSRSYTAPFGTPGEAFGGINIAGTDARLPAYRIVVDGEGSEGQIASVSELALAPRSSKSLATRMSFEPELSAVVPVERRSGSELLQGRLVNPLPVDLLDGMLIYGNWVYMLPTRFVGGGEIDSVTDLRQKNFRWQLSRQQVLEKNAVKRETWVPSNFDSPNRMAEMLMFHGAVGGIRYTGLNHDALSFLDLSKVLTADRAMLVGRVRDPLWDIQLADRQGNESSTSGEVLSMLRIVLPVETKPRR